MKIYNNNVLKHYLFTRDYKQINNLVEELKKDDCVFVEINKQTRMVNIQNISGINLNIFFIIYKLHIKLYQFN